MENPIFTQEGLYHIFRWIHFLAGITWIGMLYYFNFVQGAFFNETDPATKSTCVRQLLPRALWWFRWGAAFTFLSGLVMLMHRAHLAGMEIFYTSWGFWILIGATLGTLMAFNVWFLIWPAQKVVIASAHTVASGGQADPNAASCAARAALASRTNAMFSIPMLFFMGAASHLPLSLTEGSAKCAFLLIGLLLLALEVNALKGKMGPMKSIVGVIHCGLALSVALYIIAVVCT